MNVIDQIVRLSGPVPDEAAFRRYLGTLPNRVLLKKLADLEAEAARPAPQASWRAGLRRAEIKIS